MPLYLAVLEGNTRMQRCPRDELCYICPSQNHVDLLAIWQCSNGTLLVADNALCIVVLHKHMHADVEQGPLYDRLLVVCLGRPRGGGGGYIRVIMLRADVTRPGTAMPPVQV